MWFLTGLPKDFDQMDAIVSHDPKKFWMNWEKLWNNHPYNITAAPVLSSEHQARCLAGQGWKKNAAEDCLPGAAQLKLPMAPNSQKSISEGCCGPGDRGWVRISMEQAFEDHLIQSP